MTALESDQQELAETLYVQVCGGEHLPAWVRAPCLGVCLPLRAAAAAIPRRVAHAAAPAPPPAPQDARLHMAAGGNYEHVALTLYQCGTLQVCVGGGGLCVRPSAQLLG